MKNKLEGDELLWLVQVPGWFLYAWALDNADVRNIKICGSDNSNSKHVEIKSNDQFSDFRCRLQLRNKYSKETGNKIYFKYFKRKRKIYFGLHCSYYNSHLYMNGKGL